MLADCHGSPSTGILRPMAPKKTQAGRPELIATGRRIRAAADAAGLKQAQLAEAVGVKAHTMWRYMEGVTDPKNNLYAISRAVGVSVEHLRGDDEAPLHDDAQSVIERFVLDIGPTFKPPLTAAEARQLRMWPYHRVTAGKLLDFVTEMRRGLAAEEISASTEATAAAQAKGDALGVRRRKART
jgi:transcriptional regulator with XRE-family HTH domain